MATAPTDDIKSAADEGGLTADVAATRQSKRDPVTSGLWIAILLVIALTLVTVVYALFANVFGSGAPRTMAQFKLQSAKAKIDAGSKEGTDWVSYILVLTDEGQYRQAQEWIDKGKKVLKEDAGSGDMLYVQANLYEAEGEADKALKTADVGLKTIKDAHAEALAAYKKTGAPTEASIGLHDNYWELLLLKAEIYEQKKDWKKAKAAYDAYLTQNETAATVFVSRGEVKEKLKDTKGAEADFRRALAFIPDNVEALAGLKRIGAEK